MNRTEYMRELDALLHGISKEEREEAMQYYNDYFDDAGSENEEKSCKACRNDPCRDKWQYR